jgi:hypothetical protein
LLCPPQALSFRRRYSSEPGHFAHSQASGAILELSDAEPFHITVLPSENKEDAVFSLRF